MPLLQNQLVGLLEKSEDSKQSLLSLFWRADMNFAGLRFVFGKSSLRFAQAFHSNATYSGD